MGRAGDAVRTTFDDIAFNVIADPDSGVYRDWTITPMDNGELIPYSSLWVEEEIGYAPASVTWRLSFETREAYFAFLARLRQVGILTVLAGYQSLKGTQKALGNPPRVYEVLNAVKLVGISNQSLYVGGEVECDATFERMVDPVTRKAVIA